MDIQPKKYLLDSEIIIDYLAAKPGNPDGEAARKVLTMAFTGEIDAGISPITDFELWVGVKNHTHERQHKVLLAKLRRYQFHASIARRAGTLFHPFLSLPKGAHKPPIPDVILVATAEYNNAIIITKDKTDFPLFVDYVQTASPYDF